MLPWAWMMMDDDDNDHAPLPAMASAVRALASATCQHQGPRLTATYIVHGLPSPSTQMPSLLTALVAILPTDIRIASFPLTPNSGLFHMVAHLRAAHIAPCRPHHGGKHGRLRHRSDAQVVRCQGEQLRIPDASGMHQRQCRCLVQRVVGGGWCVKAYARGKHGAHGQGACAYLRNWGQNPCTPLKPGANSRRARGSWGQTPVDFFQTFWAPNGNCPKDSCSRCDTTGLSNTEGTRQNTYNSCNWSHMAHMAPTTRAI